MIRFDPVERAITDITVGEIVVVVDDKNRENEGDTIFATEKATPEPVAFMVHYFFGYTYTPLITEDCECLSLPPMVSENEDARDTAYTATVDANTGTTGVSATDRVNIIRTLADPTSSPHDFTRPGHVVPLRAREGGVLVRAGHTEAAVNLARLVGFRPIGMPCEVVSEEDLTGMMRSEELRRFRDEHDLALISTEQLIECRRHSEHLIEHVVETRLLTDCSEFRTIGYRSLIGGVEHAAFAVGDVSSNDGRGILVRVHPGCLTGDALGSRRCDCGQQLHNSMHTVHEVGRGIIFYMRGREG